ncbi:MAG TPA: recombinase family protein [Candidatus Mediterraneibacter faecipullorum]|uniref:Recombinase family protein n=1 Tax=Candidatus Mediterraneibacter faecipullorum TaxID=2838670 RepID=A0A9D2NQ22_9FIRM|nr:recombinase family protein [Candidatus Mediterraneibacter faecipullorum]
MPEIEIIAATKTLQQQPLSVATRKKRVAAYARVSTEQDEQQSSYEAQVDFYTRHIKSNPDWEFVEVFADRGITGTNTKNRENFNRMIDLALKGGIDIILTKSISRFARNTVDTLQTVRELKAVGVEVRFEKENLHTFDPKCEMMLTIMSSLAQEESRSISENVRWGKQKSMRDGKVSLPYSHFLGYKKGADGRPEIVEEEAAVIRKIYDLFLSGKTINEIAAILTSMGVLTPAGKKKWSVSTVRRILSNEKYKGEALLQKTFTVDYLTKEVRKNNGEVPSVRVQAILAESAKRRAKVRTRHPFAGKLVCGDCGSFYGHKVWRLRSTGERYNVWYCNHKYDGDKTCDSPRLRDEEIKAAFEKMLQKCSDANPVYTDERWNKLVESVKVCRGGHLIFTLTDGRIVKVTLQDH